MEDITVPLVLPEVPKGELATEEYANKVPGEPVVQQVALEA